MGIKDRFEFFKFLNLGVGTIGMCLCKNLISLFCFVYPNRCYSNQWRLLLHLSYWEGRSLRLKGHLRVFCCSKIEAG